MAQRWVSYQTANNPRRKRLRFLNRLNYTSPGGYSRPDSEQSEGQIETKHFQVADARDDFRFPETWPTEADEGSGTYQGILWAAVWRPRQKAAELQRVSLA